MAKGGKRPGAGRPKGAVSDLRSKVIASQVLDEIGEAKAWLWAYKTAKKNDNVRAAVEILTYLTNRRDGKPVQPLSTPVDQPLTINVIHRVPRPERE